MKGGSLRPKFDAEYLRATVAAAVEYSSRTGRRKIYAQGVIIP